MKGIADFYNATAHDWAEKWYADTTMLPLLEKFVNLFHAKPCLCDSIDTAQEVHQNHKKGPRILDAGCGAGYESMRLTNLGAEVVGVDISEESIKIARERNPGLRFEVMDLRQLDNSLGIFDGVVAISSIIHIEDNDLPTVFHNFKQIIKPAGFLFLAIVEGEGLSERRSFVEVMGEQYNRAFYLHMGSRLTDIARQSGFEYYEEWFLDEPVGQWKYLVFKSQCD